ncbi:MAG: hypothetical protein JRD89_03525 [Deltaproteobacteria bacterium]|nr:hypothetical protein [Deltaproteobacteria bacterium]
MGRKSRKQNRNRKRRAKAAAARFIPPPHPMADPQAWLNTPLPICPRCGLPHSTVQLRLNPFFVEGIDVCPEYIKSCLACWQERKDDI